MTEPTNEDLIGYIKTKAYQLQQVLSDVPPHLMQHVFQTWQLMAKQAVQHEIIEGPDLVSEIKEPEESKDEGRSTDPEAGEQHQAEEGPGQGVPDAADGPKPE